MQCYFHLFNGDERIPDEEGLELTDLDDARRQAREAVAEILQEGENEAEVWRGWELQVADVLGNVIYTISLDKLPA